MGRTDAARIVVTGYAGLLPGGGIAWDYLQYVLGLRALGHDAYYVEDTDVWPIYIDGDERSAGARVVDRLRRTMHVLGLGDRWAYRDPIADEWHGLSHGRRREVVSGADILINVSASARVDHYLHIPHRLFIDSDPMFTQAQIATGANLQGEPVRLADEVAAHTRHFTFGLNVGADDCDVPTCGIDWIPTVQPISLEHWQHGVEAPAGRFTTVMNWAAAPPFEFGGRSWGQKDIQFAAVEGLPARHSDTEFVVAAGGRSTTMRPDHLRRTGWHVVDATILTATPEDYRDFIVRSSAEFSVAKHAYVQSRSGWFSGRSACYLAAGRPVVAEDTGWSVHLPSGSGLLAFDDEASASAAVDALLSDPAVHGAAALEVARAHFAAENVLTALLHEGCGT